MTKLLLGALICLSGVAAHANPSQLSIADRALLRHISQDQYQAVLYTMIECGFESSPGVAVALLKSPALPPITVAMAAMSQLSDPAPLLDQKACAAFGLNRIRTAGR